MHCLLNFLLHPPLKMQAEIGPRIKKKLSLPVIIIILLLYEDNTVGLLEHRDNVVCKEKKVQPYHLQLLSIDYVLFQSISKYIQ